MSVKTSRSGFQWKQEPVFFRSVGSLVKTADVASLFKMEGVLEPVPVDHRIEEGGGILGGTGAKSVQAQRVFVVFTVFAVFAAGVHFAEHQFPVEPLFFFVVVHRAAPPEILYLYRLVGVAGDDDGIAVSLSSLVDGVG